MVYLNFAMISPLCLDENCVVEFVYLTTNNQTNYETELPSRRNKKVHKAPANESRYTTQLPVYA